MSSNFKIGKKAIATQSFNIITAVIIMGIILIFGGTSVYKLINNADDVEKAQFRNSFDSEINDISSKYGSVKYITLDGLRSYDYFCVFDVYDTVGAESNYEADPIISKFPLIMGDLEDKTANVFLISNKIEERFFNDKIQVSSEKGYFCEEISSNGAIKLKLEGLGKTVRVTFVS